LREAVALVAQGVVLRLQRVELGRGSAGIETAAAQHAAKLLVLALDPVQLGEAAGIVAGTQSSDERAEFHDLLALTFCV